MSMGQEFGPSVFVQRSRKADVFAAYRSPRGLPGANARYGPIPFPALRPYPPSPSRQGLARALAAPAGTHSVRAVCRPQKFPWRRKRLSPICCWGQGGRPGLRSATARRTLEVSGRVQLGRSVPSPREKFCCFFVCETTVNTSDTGRSSTPGVHVPNWRGASAFRADPHEDVQRRCREASIPWRRNRPRRPTATRRRHSSTSSGCRSSSSRYRQDWNWGISRPATVNATGSPAIPERNARAWQPSDERSAIAAMKGDRHGISREACSGACKRRSLAPDRLHAGVFSEKA